MSTILDNASMTVASAPGTGPATLAAAVAGFQTFAAAGVTNGATISYAIQDVNNVWEYGHGTYSSTGPTLTRTTILGSSSGGAAVALTSNATVTAGLLAEDLAAIVAPQAANTVLAGPASGSAVPASLRSLVGADLSGASFGGDLNVLRNGHFDVAQRGTSGTVATGVTAYTIDGWIIQPTGSTVTWTQVYNANLAGNALRISCTSGLTACNLLHRIESLIAAKLLSARQTGVPATFQIQIFNSTSAAITAQITSSIPSAKDSFGTVNADLPATSLQTVAAGAFGTLSITFEPGANVTASGVTLADVAFGYQINLEFGGALNASSGFIDLSFADLRSTPGLPIGLNNNPPPPELRPIPVELALNQRYLFVVPSGWMFSAVSASTANFGLTVCGNFPVTMRVSPTSSNITFSTNDVSVSLIAITINSVGLAGVSPAAGFLEFEVATGTFSAEL
jgi:hypothetical protein